MLTPIVCLACGFPIAHVAEPYRSIRRKRMEKALNDKEVLPEHAPLDPDLRVSMEDILAEFGIIYLCCRTHLATALNFRDYY